MIGRSGGGEAPAFVFVRPQLGVNIGAAARGMKNFGIGRMRLVSPPENWCGTDAVARASGAADVLDGAVVCDSLEDAVSGSHFVYATTVRQRGLWKPVLSPREAMRDAAARVGVGQAVSVLFGPERTGLCNDEIVLANAVVTVPTSPAFRSMNLAHCATLIAYEWHIGRGVPRVDAEVTETASIAARCALAMHMITDLEACGYFDVPEDVEAKRLYLKNMLIRLDLTEAEVKTMHRIRKTLRGKTPGGSES